MRGKRAANGSPAERQPGASIKCLHFECIVAIMPNLSIRGLDDAALAELKARAARENASVNTVVLGLIDQGLGRRKARPALRRQHDLDDLAGQWTAEAAAEFGTATAPFADIDAPLWK